MSQGRVQVWNVYVELSNKGLSYIVQILYSWGCWAHAEMNWTHVSGDILIWACVWMVQLENSTQSSVMLHILPINPCHVHKTAACTISSSPDPEDRPCAVIPVWSWYQIDPKIHSGSFKSVFGWHRKPPRMFFWNNDIWVSSLHSWSSPLDACISSFLHSLHHALSSSEFIYKSPSDDVLMRTDWSAGNFCSSTCLSVSLTLILCSTQLGGSETEADSLPSPLW